MSLPGRLDPSDITTETWSVSICRRPHSRQGYWRVIDLKPCVAGILAPWESNTLLFDDVELVSSNNINYTAWHMEAIKLKAYDGVIFPRTHDGSRVRPGGKWPTVRDRR